MPIRRGGRAESPRPQWITELSILRGCGQPAGTPVPQFPAAPRAFAFGLTRWRLPTAFDIKPGSKRGHFNFGLTTMEVELTPTDEAYILEHCSDLAHTIGVL